MIAQLLKFLLILVAIAFLGVVGYAYLGNMVPEQTDVRQPVELQIGN
ncbi:MAG: hypothetical protein RLZZ528_1472 [Pseudomonadota bacterium]|jgi:hypothetical protein